MTTSLKQQATARVTPGSTSTTATFPTAPTVGNLLVLQLSLKGNVTVTPPAGWTQLANLTAASVTLYQAWKVSNGSETTVTVSHTATAGGQAMEVAECVDTGSGAWSVLGTANHVTDGSSPTTWTTGTTAATGKPGMAIAVMATDVEQPGAGWSAGWASAFASGGGGANSGLYVATQADGPPGAIGASLSFSGSVVSETFPSNGAGVPTGWTQTINYGSVSVSNGVLSLVTGTGGYAVGPGVAWAAMTPVADFEVTYDLGIQPIEYYPVVAWRADATPSNGQYPTNGLGIEFQPNPNSNHWQAVQVVNGTKSQLGIGDLALTDGVRVNVRERFVGTSWKMRLWNAGTQEPTTWMLDVNNADLVAAGRLYIGQNGGGSGTAIPFDIDNILVTPIAGSSTVASTSFPTNGAGVPTGWTQTLAGGSVAVTAGALAVTSPAASYTSGPAVVWTAMPAVADFEATFDVGIATTAEQYPVVAWRADSGISNGQYPYNGIAFEFQPAQGHWIAVQVTNGVKVQLGTNDLGMVAGTRILMRWRLNGAAVQIRYWNAGTTEPTTWNLDTSTTLTTAGRAFVGENSGGSATPTTIDIDNIVVTAIGGTGGSGSTTAVPMPTGALADFTLAWSENFKDNLALGGFVGADWSAGGDAGKLPVGNPYRDRIKVYVENQGYAGDQGNGRYYSSRTMSTHHDADTSGADGVMDIWLHYENVDGADRILSGWLKPDRDRDWQYGRYYIRMRVVNPAAGLGGVHLLIPPQRLNNWPQGGELDWGEGQYSDPIAGGWNHLADPAATRANYGDYQVHVDAGPGVIWPDWHTFLIDWRPGRLRWYCDGNMRLDTTDRVPTSLMEYVVYQSGINGNMPALNVSTHVQIDWAVAYDYTPGTAGAAT